MATVANRRVASVEVRSQVCKADVSQGEKPGV